MRHARAVDQPRRGGPARAGRRRAGTSDRPGSSGPIRWVSMREQAPELVLRAVDEEADGHDPALVDDERAPQRDLVDLGAIALRRVAAGPCRRQAVSRTGAATAAERKCTARARFRRRGRQELGEQRRRDRSSTITAPAAIASFWRTSFPSMSRHGPIAAIASVPTPLRSSVIAGPPGISSRRTTPPSEVCTSGIRTLTQVAGCGDRAAPAACRRPACPPASAR